jgi:hypothetical protein
MKREGIKIQDSSDSFLRNGMLYEKSKKIRNAQVVDYSSMNLVTGARAD